MARHTNRGIDSHNVPPQTLGRLEDFLPIDVDKRVNLKQDLDELNEREKRMFRR